MKQIYLDYSATTPVKEEVVKEMMPYFTEQFGNPSSLYDIGAASKAAITAAREKVSRLINCKPSELYFTSGGTESDNWTLFGVTDALKKKGNHIITTQIEHHAILHSCDYLEKHGVDVTYLPVDKEGFVRAEDLEEAITDRTVLVSIMYVNNEVGTVQNIKELARIAHEHGVLFHTDAVQALGNVNCDVKALDVDFMSMSSHKIYGPKGVGALYIKRGSKISNYMHGGAQESSWPVRTLMRMLRTAASCVTTSLIASRRRSMTSLSMDPERIGIRGTPISPSNTSKANRSFFCSTRRAYPFPQVLPAAVPR